MVHKRIDRIVKFLLKNNHTSAPMLTIISSILCIIISGDRFWWLSPRINIFMNIIFFSFTSLVVFRTFQRTKSICAKPKINISNISSKIRVYQIQVFPRFCIWEMIDLAIRVNMQSSQIDIIFQPICVIGKFHILWTISYSDHLLAVYIVVSCRCDTPTALHLFSGIQLSIHISIISKDKLR